jgi:Carboxylesterase family
MIPAPKLDSTEFELIKKFVSLVTSFIIKGDPNNSSDDFNFESVSTDSFSCLGISNDSIKMIELPEKERMKVWDEILQDVNVPAC